MIHDLFLYNGESDILELRFATLDAVVDHFVLAEATVTFSGQAKTPVFDPRDPRFAQYAAKITHLIIDDTPDTKEFRWGREWHQRNALIRGIPDAASNDLVIISDVDEIPDPDTLASRQRGGYQCQVSNYHLNTIEAGALWIGPVVKYACEVRAVGTEHLRKYRYGFRRVSPGGWHFTYMADEAGILKKLSQFSHDEYDTETGHAKVLGARKDLKSFVTGESMKRVDIASGYFPKYLKEHQDKFQHLIIA